MAGKVGKRAGQVGWGGYQEQMACVASGHLARYAQR